MKAHSEQQIRESFLLFTLTIMPCVAAAETAPRYDWEDPSIIGRNFRVLSTQARYIS